jgi:hypothetical protein
MAEKWLNVQALRPSAVMRLLCFPWGGGGSNVYATRWTRLFEDSIEGDNDHVKNVCSPTSW